MPWATVDARAGAGCLQICTGARALSWHEIWKIDAQPVETQWQRDADFPHLNGLFNDVEAARHRSAHYKERAAIGNGLAHPEHVALSSEDTIHSFLVTARVLLMLGNLPNALDWLIVALIPNASGGDRLIGISRPVSELSPSPYGELTGRCGPKNRIDIIFMAGGATLRRHVSGASLR